MLSVFRDIPNFLDDLYIYNKVKEGYLRQFLFMDDFVITISYDDCAVMVPCWFGTGISPLDVVYHPSRHYNLCSIQAVGWFL